jgi:hypothetical protein
MREMIDDEVFALGASTYAQDGYITDSWLWARMQAMEKEYLDAVQREIIENCLLVEIPIRSKDKLYKLIQKGTKIFSLY